jgi:hypothetical protein
MTEAYRRVDVDLPGPRGAPGVVLAPTGVETETVSA